MSLILILTYLLVGIFAGFSSGLFGIGGGVVIVPILLLVFGLQQFPPELVTQMAVATSLACIIFSSASSALTHHRHGTVLLPVLIRLGVGVLVGSYAGVLFAISVKGSFLQLIFAVFLFFIGFQIWFNFSPRSKTELDKSRQYPIVGAIIGFASSIFGIGGGTLTVPYLMMTGNEPKQAVGTSSALGFVIAMVSVVSFVLAPDGDVQFPPYTLSYIYLPAVAAISVIGVWFARVGAKLVQRMDQLHLKRAFAIYVWCVSTSLFVKLAIG